MKQSVHSPNRSSSSQSSLFQQTNQQDDQYFQYEEQQSPILSPAKPKNSQRMPLKKKSQTLKAAVIQQSNQQYITPQPQKSNTQMNLSNLSRDLEDRMSIYVPSMGAIVEKSMEETKADITKEGVSPVNKTVTTNQLSPRSRVLKLFTSKFVKPFEQAPPEKQDDSLADEPIQISNQFILKQLMDGIRSEKQERQQQEQQQLDRQQPQITIDEPQRPNKLQEDLKRSLMARQLQAIQQQRNQPVDGSMMSDLEVTVIDASYMDVSGRKSKKKKKKKAKKNAIPPASIKSDQKDSIIDQTLYQEPKNEIHETDENILSFNVDNRSIEALQQKEESENNNGNQHRKSIQDMTQKIIKGLNLNLKNDQKGQQFFEAIKKKVADSMLQKKMQDDQQLQMTQSLELPTHLQISEKKQSSRYNEQKQSSRQNEQKQSSRNNLDPLKQFFQKQIGQNILQSTISNKMSPQFSQAGSPSLTMKEQENLKQDDNLVEEQDQRETFNFQKTMKQKFENYKPPLKQNLTQKRVNVDSYFQTLTQNSQYSSENEHQTTSKLPELRQSKTFLDTYADYNRSRNQYVDKNSPFIHNQTANDQAFAFKSLDLIKREIDKEMNGFKKELRQINLRCAAQGNDLIYQKQLLHKVKIELLDEREEEFKNLVKVFIELHDAIDERMRDLQKQYDQHIDKTIKQVDSCMIQLDHLIIGLDQVQDKNRQFILADQLFEEDKERIDLFLKQEYPLKFRDINQKMQMIKLAKFEFPSFDINTDRVKEVIKKIGSFKVSSIANVNYGLQRFYQNKDPSESQMIFQFRWNTRDVYYFDAEINKWSYIQEIIPKEPFLYFSSVIYLPKGLGAFIIGGLDSEDNYSKRCLWFKKYKSFYEKCPMLTKRAFFCSLYSQIDCQIYIMGGYDGKNDINKCEKYSLYENVWREIAPMNVARNGAACLLLKHLKFIFMLGGSNQSEGSLNLIERYDLEFDKWSIMDLRLPIPMHDFSVFLMSTQDEDTCKLLIFGGQSHDEYIKRAYILDCSLEITRNKERSLLHTKIGKIYYPMCQIDQRRSYVFSGYSDELLQPYIIDTKTFKIVKVELKKQLDERVGDGITNMVGDVLIDELSKVKSNLSAITNKQQSSQQATGTPQNESGQVYKTETIKSSLNKIVEKMKDYPTQEQSSGGFSSYKGYTIKMVPTQKKKMTL